MGRKRRTRLAQWCCTACARDVEGFVIIVVVVVVVAGSPSSVIYGRMATSPFLPRAAFLSRQSLASSLSLVVDEFYARLLLTSEYPVQRARDLSRRRAWKASGGRCYLRACLKHRPVPLRGRLNFEIMREEFPSNLTFSFNFNSTRSLFFYKSGTRERIN